MKKQDIIVGLGLKIMDRDNSLSAKGTKNLINKFFRGCKNISAMQERITINGGYDNCADILADHPVRIWKTKGKIINQKWNRTNNKTNSN